MTEASTKLLIGTDLDRTLIPNGPEPVSAEAMPRFRRLTQRPEIALAYISGRDLALVLKAIHQYQLPIPHAIIADVGSSLYLADEHNQWQADHGWSQHIDKDWSGQNTDLIKSLLEQLKPLRVQEFSKQARHKLSFYVDQHAMGPGLEQQVQQLLQQAGFNSSCIWSFDEPAAIGLLDVLPASASKLQALQHLMQYWGFEVSNTVFCGDSGNDMEVLASPVAAVLVKNASPEVQHLARQQSRQMQLEAQLYQAQGEFLGMNGCYSGGMLEGIAHYHPHTQAWMD